MFLFNTMCPLAIKLLESTRGGKDQTLFDIVYDHDEWPAES